MLIAAPETNAPITSGRYHAYGQVPDKLPTVYGRHADTCFTKRNLPEPKVPEAMRASGQRMGSAARYFFRPMYVPRWVILKGI